MNLNNNEFYKNKYLKYKNKYVNLNNSKCSKCNQFNCDNNNICLKGGKCMINNDDDDDHDDDHEYEKDDEKPILMLFKANWCGHCQNFFPEWEKLQQTLSGRCKMIKYDDTDDATIMRQHNITGYPTIKIAYKSEIIEYNEDRTAENITQFLKKLTKP